MKSLEYPYPTEHLEESTTQLLKCGPASSVEPWPLHLTHMMGSAKPRPSQGTHGLPAPGAVIFTLLPTQIAHCSHFMPTPTPGPAACYECTL
jgi:hypothetical protein